MKIDYKILWLDDKIDEFINDDYIKEIEDHLKEEEFDPHIDSVNNQEEFYRLLERNDYDLILTDFHLNEVDGIQNNGDKIVEKIRTDKIFTEILFYTAKADLKGSLTWDRISFLETSHSVQDHHEAVIDKAKALIDLTIKKFHNIVIMRGMIMNETSFLDEEKGLLLKKFIESKKYEDNIHQVRERLFNEVSHFLKEKSEVIDKCIADNNLNKLMKDTVLFSSDKKISAMSEILQILGEADFSDDYKREIIKVRNDFAHAILEEQTDEYGKVIRKYFKKGNINFDQEYCKTIRRNINKHKENLKSLNNKINE